MSLFTPRKHAKDPCLQIQADLSAMCDGELDAASIRRVMVHSDVCDSCKDFLHGIRTQAHAHREVAEAMSQNPESSVKARELRRQLTENREQLAKILYELGRGFVFMGISPRFSRVVAREPVPVPDMAQRGRHFVDQLERQSPTSANGAANGAAASEWVRARDLFASGYVNSPAENLEKGKRLLREVLALDPNFHAARIYLGHALHVEGQRVAARGEFEVVLRDASDVVMRAFALENVGNVWLEEGYPQRAMPYFVELVESGVIQKETRFFTTYFNLAIACGLTLEFAACESWLKRLYDEFPHKRPMILREFRSRANFAAVLQEHPTVLNSFRTQFPCWFSVPMEAC